MVSTGYIPCRRMVNRLTTLEICLGVNTIISTEGLAVGAGGSTGCESNIARHPLLPQISRTSPLWGRTRAAYSLAAPTIADQHRGRAFALVPGTDEALQTAETTNVTRRAFRTRITRTSAFFPAVGLGWVISQAASSTSHFKTTHHHQLESAPCNIVTKRGRSYGCDRVGVDEILDV